MTVLLAVLLAQRKQGDMRLTTSQANRHTRSDAAGNAAAVLVRQDPTQEIQKTGRRAAGCLGDAVFCCVPICTGSESCCAVPLWAFAGHRVIGWSAGACCHAEAVALFDESW